MIKRNVKDFNYDNKEYESYKRKNCIKDVNKLTRLKWKLYLKKTILSLEEEKSVSYVRTLRK